MTARRQGLLLKRKRYLPPNTQRLALKDYLYIDSARLDYHRPVGNFCQRNLVL